jgi:thiol-disulfide isomerase/thioredoxin
MNFLKNNWSNLLFALLIALLLIPQTSMPIRVFFSRLVAMSPSEVADVETIVLKDYHWDLTSLDGKEVDFSQSEGRVALVNLWATWCPPCVAEMPSLQKLYDLYGDKVDFYFVSSEAPEMLRKFLKKKGYNFPVYIETSRPPSELQTKSIPRTFLISKEGKIVIDESGAADWNSESVEKLIDKLVSE